METQCIILYIPPANCLWAGILFVGGYTVCGQVHCLWADILFAGGYTVWVQVYCLWAGILFVGRYTVYGWVYCCHVRVSICNVLLLYNQTLHTLSYIQDKYF